MDSLERLCQTIATTGAKVVTSAHPAATAAGAAAYAQGGNAFDAALAACFMETVALPMKCGLAGDLVALYRRADGSFETIVSVGPGPQALAQGAVLERLGPRSVGIPGAPDGYATLHGMAELSLSKLVAPAIKAAELGLPWSWAALSYLDEAEELLGRYSPHHPYCPHGRRPQLGDLRRLPGLGQLLAAFADLGADLFTGDHGKRLVADVQSRLQRLLESDGVTPPRATLSFNDYITETNRLFSGGNPKWSQLDLTNQAISAASFGAQMGSSTINFGHVADFEFQDTTVSAWYKDNKQETVDASLAAARRAVDTVGEEHPEFRVRMASGVIALQQAMNSVVERFHIIIMVMVNLAVMVLSVWAYRSIVASIVLLIPVNLSNFYLVAAMQMLGVGLDVNAGIVAVMGVGVGIDYGIYLLSRICEEYTAHGHDVKKAINAAMTTTGKAIMFTATIMLIGILPWYFLSDLKFMADMGILLVAVMMINMLLSLIVLPLLVWFFEPKFMRRTDLLVGENIDLTQFTTKADV